MADREDIAYLSDIDGRTGNLAVFGARDLVDSGISKTDVALRSEMSGEVQSAVADATSEIWNAVNGVYAIEAYKSDEWEQGAGYSAGDYCMHGGAGYRCTSENPSTSEFDPSDWRLVLTPAGKRALDALVEGFPKDGMATLLDLAPRYDPEVRYSVGQMCVKSVSGVDRLVICTSGWPDDMAFSEDATVEASIARRIASIPTRVSELENDAGYVGKDAVGMEYDTSEHGYAVGDTCTHGGGFYRCTQEVSQGAEWDAASWEPTTLKDVVASWVIHTHPDWDEDDPDSPAYIENKPTIPPGVVIDDTLSHEGEAADAKAVGEALRGFVSVDRLSYQIVKLSEDVDDGDDTEVKFHLRDRTVNVIDNLTVSGNKVIRLELPEAPGQNLSRDFYLYANVESGSMDKIPIVVTRAYLEDCTGQSVSPYAQAGRPTVFRFTEVSAGNVFLVSGIADSVHQKMEEMEQALDVLLSGGGGEVEYIKEVYIPDENSGLFHRLTAVIDPDTGEVDIGVEQNGVPQGDFAPSVSIPDENGDYHKLVAVEDPDTGRFDIGVIH